MGVIQHRETIFLKLSHFAHIFIRWFHLITYLWPYIKLKVTTLSGSGRKLPEMAKTSSLGGVVRYAWKSIVPRLFIVPLFFCILRNSFERLQYISFSKRSGSCLNVIPPKIGTVRALSVHGTGSSDKHILWYFKMVLGTFVPCYPYITRKYMSV